MESPRFNYRTPFDAFASSTLLIDAILFSFYLLEDNFVPFGDQIGDRRLSADVPQVG